ncbi:GNAT family N-acetyltransferase [Limibaculum sp. FT325]|uniref:GNAT family N-acetyltransferase n=1 Tax=Thermohalobaculum sediminis TaxID=2939436 RepID=UPI0020BFDE31|nr:GNAT family N-acetyltransferase [Limibaculum sediminis]MCL5777662.1 GNAT family N-acetyltransferase [Limibaculum sediminis]
MIELPFPFRLATRDDAPALADLVNFAGEGLPLTLWTGMAAPGEDPWEVGRRRQADKTASALIVVADEGDGVRAALTGYAVGAEPEEITGDLPPEVVPLIELENLVPSTWYVNVLAAYPEARGRGLGSRLLGLAEEIARDEGCPAMSIIVADANEGARRLYERTGYAERARRAMVRGRWQGAGRDWVLLVKPLRGVIRAPAGDGENSMS